MFSGSYLHGSGHVHKEIPTQREKDELLAQIIKKKGWANHPNKKEAENGRKEE